MEYSVRGKPTGAPSNADTTFAALWNPHATQRVRVKQLGVCQTTAPSAGMSLYLGRTTTRGTPASTVTPGIQHDDDRAISPPSGLLLDLASFSVEPTKEAGAHLGWGFTNQIATGLLYTLWMFPKGVVIPPGAGLAIVAVLSAVNVGLGEVTFVVEE